MQSGETDNPSTPPPPQGVRMQWHQVPASVRKAVEERLSSPVAQAFSQPSGFSPGVAARMQLADGRRVFLKALGPEPNPESPAIHRREARIMAALPAEAPVPPLLATYDEGEGGWIVLVFADIEGRHPQQPWEVAELDRVMSELSAMLRLLTPSPLPLEIAGLAGDAFSTFLCGWQRLLAEEPSRLDRLDAWSRDHIEDLAEIERTAAEAVAGDTLLHCDIRADNLLLTQAQVWFVDWPHVRIGAAWVDVLLFAPSVTMQGGPPPEQVMAKYAEYESIDADVITAAAVAMAGFFTHRSVQPPPPGLPTLRAFQAAQGEVARTWVGQRLGW